MKKDFIRDEGKIRKCDSNLSKMNIFEFIYCYVFYWGYFNQILSYIWESAKESANYLFGLTYNLIVFLLTPITLILCAIIQIRNAKERCNKHKKGTRN